MPSTTSNLLFLITLISLLPLQVSAFGAGDIPDISYLHNKAFRHGDIENILTEVAKTAGSLATGGGILQLAHSVLASGAGGSKFDKSDVKKVYFGNWLRDHSQALDIGGLSKLSSDTLVLIVAVLGFMSFGFATDEFEVTPERLGVYLPVEHIDNPKGYAAKEGGDARRFHPKLRPPVNPRELEIDPRTGMKNYMATENYGWDTSTAFIRRTLRSCIEHGRRAGGREGVELWEAYRLLGTALHTLEDLLAHSNWCEIALRKMGYRQVFCHVGDQVIINTPNGPAPPLVTGTFGGADFLHSLLGEATDRFSQTSVTDLTQKVAAASKSDKEPMILKLKSILSKVPHAGGSSQMQQAESLQAASNAYHFDPKNIAPPQVQQRLWALLKWRDGIYRSVSETIDSVPGLESLLDGLSESLDTYVYTILAPWLTPMLAEVTSTLGDASKAVIDSADQYEVFNDPHASDPTHSLLSKDHFALILNEPAGKVAQVVVQYTVNIVVQAWSDDRANLDLIISEVLEAFHHPYFNVGRSKIQDEMFRSLQRWVNDHPDRDGVIEALTKESVRSGRNKRQDETPGAPQQPPPRSAYLSSRGEEYRQETSDHKRGAGARDVEISSRGGSSQVQTGYERNVWDGPQPQPRNTAAATALAAAYYAASQDSYTRAEQRGYDDPRQPSYNRGDVYERPSDRSQYEGGYRPTYGQAETYEQRHPYEQRSPGHELRHGSDERRRYDDYSEGQQYQAAQPYGTRRPADYSERLRYQEHQPHRPHGHDDHSEGLRYQEDQLRRFERRDDYTEGLRYQEEQPHHPHRHGDFSEGLRYQEEQPYRSHRHEEHQQSYQAYRPVDEHDNDSGSDHGGYRERQGRYRVDEHTRYGGDSLGASNREGLDFGGRSAVYEREERSEDTFGFDRLNLYGRDEGHHHGHHHHEERRRGYDEYREAEY
ncbi:heterokaryon incompatibility protein Het-C-domain-containing protein [Russula earlei]|uniref:Heterokaryon incompatibility protein Het-C-domain-containing protein n=1 Tax=Russula earlei TaxID=71964 RepID=A0ACC0UKY0_9AGAM|nr:heterokaryon incompatibility protein Het-C-domain-containing protein [Russula earlei]